MEKEILELLKNLTKEVTSLTKEVTSMKEDIEIIKSQTKENTQILKALEHSAQVNKSEHDTLINTLVHVQGDITSIKTSLCQVELVTANNWRDITNLKLNSKEPM